MQAKDISHLRLLIKLIEILGLKKDFKFIKMNLRLV